MSPAVREPFGATAAGEPVEIFTLANAALRLRVMTYGATIVSLEVPGHDGLAGDVVLGYDSLAGYLEASPYFGAVVGRYANRIAQGRFTLDGKRYQLAVNDGVHHLHGGRRGFDKAVWRADRADAGAVTLRHTSPAGDEGYPGTLRAAVTYSLVGSQVVIDCEAETDQATPVNLTQHSYFNLAGRGDVLGHVLQLNAETYTPVDATLIPTGAIERVAGTPFDFRSPRRIGDRIGADHEQLGLAGGYDHNFVIDQSGAPPRLAARLHDTASGRTLEVHTTEPGLQLYSGNFLDGTIRGKRGLVYGPRAGLCLETQHFPDAPNRPAFPATILRPGRTLLSRTSWTFGVRP